MTGIAKYRNESTRHHTLRKVFAQKQSNPNKVTYFHFESSKDGIRKFTYIKYL